MTIYLRLSVGSVGFIECVQKALASFNQRTFFLPVGYPVVALLPVDELHVHSGHGRAHPARAQLVRRHAGAIARGFSH